MHLKNLTQHIESSLLSLSGAGGSGVETETSPTTATPLVPAAKITSNDRTLPKALQQQDDSAAAKAAAAPQLDKRQMWELRRQLQKALDISPRTAEVDIWAVRRAKLWIRHFPKPATDAGAATDANGTAGKVNAA